MLQTVLLLLNSCLPDDENKKDPKRFSWFYVDQKICLIKYLEYLIKMQTISGWDVVVRSAGLADTGRWCLGRQTATTTTSLFHNSFYFAEAQARLPAWLWLAGSGIFCRIIAVSPGRQQQSQNIIKCIFWAVNV